MATYLIDQLSMNIDVVERASLWLCRFYPDVEIERSKDRFMLTSDTRSSTQIEAAFKAALLTEKIHSASRPQRRAAIEELVL